MRNNKKIIFLKFFLPFFIPLTILFAITLTFLTLPENKIDFMSCANKMIISITILYLLTTAYIIKHILIKLKHTIITKKFRSNQNLLSIINNCIKYAIIVIDNNNNIEYWSKKAEDIFLFNENETIGKNIYDLIFQNENASKFNNKKENKIPYNETATLKDKNKLLVEVISTPVKIENNYWHVLTLEDVAEKEKKYQDLIKNKEQLDCFMKYTPHPIAIFDLKLNYVTANANWYKDFNITEPDIAGKNLYEMFPQIKENKKWVDIHKKALQGQSAKIDEDKFIRSNGFVEWFKWEIHPWKNSKDEIQGIIIFSEVITQQKQIKIQLEKHRDALRNTIDQKSDEMQKTTAILENNPAPFIQTDTKGNILTCNPAMQDLLNSDKPIKNLAQVFPHNIQEINQQVASRNQFQIEQKINNKTYLFTFIYCRNINSVYVYGVDISKINQENQELKKLNYSINHSDISIFGLDTRGYIFYANQAASRNLEYSQEEIIKLHAKDVDLNMTKDSWVEIRDKIEKEKSSNIESIHVTKNGKRIPVNISIKYLTYEDTKFFIAFVFDISERKKSENELISKTNQLKDFNQAMIGRELRVIELKKEINNLCTALGKAEKYPAVWDE